MTSALRSSVSHTESALIDRTGPATASPGSQDVEIIPVESRRLREEFIRIPWTVFKDDPNWVPPLLMNERSRIGAVDKDSADRSGRRLWIARLGGQPVGRVSAQISRSPSDQSVGQFGWIDAIDSDVVFDALFNAAERWLSEQGVGRVLGPFSFSINEESGVLIDGFDVPPMILMPHSKPYYSVQLERLGYAKEIDLFAYKLDVRSPLPPSLLALHKRALEDPDVKLRQMIPERYEDEIVTVLDLFNDAWSGNWGFEPFSKDQMTDMAHSLKPLLPQAFVSIAEYKGRPVAFGLGLPNINEVIRDLNGRMFPIGWAKLLYRIKSGRYGSGRLPLMGVRKEFQNMPIGAALAVAVVEQLRAGCRELNVYDAELSWVLETNRGVRSLLEAFGAQAYKTYRIFGRDL